MSRSLLLLLAVALIGTSQGCRICDSPYDYCGPVMPCGESCGCGAGGCGHSHYDGGYVDGGYDGGHGGCATCGNGGRHAIEHSQEYHGETIIQGQPTPAPMPAPPMNPQQGRRAAPKTMSKASYETPINSARPAPTKMQAKPSRMSPQPVNPANGNRLASGGKSDSGRGLIFW